MDDRVPSTAESHSGVSVEIVLVFPNFDGFTDESWFKMFYLRDDFRIFKIYRVSHGFVLRYG